ncbi:MAG: LPS export ABC transporter permease LptF [Desulfovibrionaceae bacterium]
MHRNIFRELLSLFALTLGALLSLILIGRVLQMRDLFMSLNLDIMDLGLLFVYLGPFFLLLLIPIACMLSVFLTFLRMSTDRELVALKAGGVSLYQMLPAPLLFCVLCTVLNVWVSVHGIAWGMDNFRATILDYAKTKTQLALQPGIFNRDFPGLVVYARQADAATGLLEDVLVQDRTRSDMTATILAPRGLLRTETDTGRLSFVLRDGSIYRQEGDRVSVLEFGAYAVRLNLGNLFGNAGLEEVKPKEMRWEQLGDIEANPSGVADKGGNYYRKIVLERQKRLALPFACLVLGLFAMPLACAFEGLKRHLGFVLAMGMFLVYYTLFSLGLTLGEGGAVAAGTGVWAPNLLFLGLGAVMFRLTARERGLHLMGWLGHLDVRRWIRRARRA